jgi:hypothetical protein
MVYSHSVYAKRTNYDFSFANKPCFNSTVLLM